MFDLDKNLQYFLKVKRLSSLTTHFLKAFQVLLGILFRLRAFYSQVQRSNTPDTNVFNVCTADTWGDSTSLDVWCSCASVRAGGLKMKLHHAWVVWAESIAHRSCPPESLAHLWLNGGKMLMLATTLSSFQAWDECV